MTSSNSPMLKWRVCFRWHRADAYEVAIVDYH